MSNSLTIGPAISTELSVEKILPEKLLSEPIVIRSNTSVCNVPVLFRGFTDIQNIILFPDISSKQQKRCNFSTKINGRYTVRYIITEYPYYLQLGWFYMTLQFL